MLYFKYIMNDDQHNHLVLEDTLALLGELEHARRHCLRSAKVATSEEDKFFYLVKASQAQRLRRMLQTTLGDIDKTDWCLLKCSASIKQLSYETMNGDMELFSELEDLTDGLSGHALKRDMTDCEACIQDAKNNIE